MKIFSVFLILLTGTFAAATWLVDDSGYVLLAWKNYTFESSFWSFLLLLLGFAVVVLGLRVILQLLLGSVNLLYPMTHTARQRRGRRLSAKGLVELIGGHWKQAHKHLSQAGADGEAPLLNYLGAAHAANQAGDYEACSEYLRLADASTPNADMAVGLTQAQMHLARGQLEQSLATLNQLRKRSPKHSYVLKLLKETYLKLGDWQALAELLPELKKRKVIAEKEYDDLQQRVWGALFDQAYNKGRNLVGLDERIEPARSVWQQLSMGQKRDAGLLYRYAKCLVALDAPQKAEALLREHLGKTYSRELILLYGRIAGADSSSQLKCAEKLVNERPNDAWLMLSLGRLSLRNKLWGKAQEYFESSLSLHRSTDAYNELGRLLAHLGEYEKSSSYFREGLTLVTGSVPELPMPEQTSSERI
ncbi:heme biosynthesis HemY N-terminal domain-containing protein [Endozoicomonadaceae bacterium StTr2]